MEIKDELFNNVLYQNNTAQQTKSNLCSALNDGLASLYDQIKILSDGTILAMHEKLNLTPEEAENLDAVYHQIINIQMETLKAISIVSRMEKAGEVIEESEEMEQ